MYFFGDCFSALYCRLCDTATATYFQMHWIVEGQMTLVLTDLQVVMYVNLSSCFMVNEAFLCEEILAWPLPRSLLPRCGK